MTQENTTSKFLLSCLALLFPLAARAQLVVTTLAGAAQSKGGSSDGPAAAARFDSPYGVAADGRGNLYVADTANSTIRVISAGGMVTTLAGLAGQTGSSDGRGAVARFDHPNGLAVDGAGNVYVADTNNNTIRKIAADGFVTTLAGTAGRAGSADGLGAAARFNSPRAVAVDDAGAVYVVDTGNYTIRKIAPSGAVTTFAGLAGSGSFASGYGSAARFYVPAGITFGADGRLYIADSGNHAVRSASPDGLISTMASPGSLRFPAGIAADARGNVYVAETDNSTIRTISPEGIIRTLAGTDQQFGSANGNGSTARFDEPRGLALDSAGNLFVADTGNHTIRRITPDGAVSNYAGPGGGQGNADGVAGAARFNFPNGVVTDDGGNVFVADTVNDVIRKIAPDGTVSTFVFGQGIKSPFDLALDRDGNLYVSNGGDRTIKKISPAGAVTTLAGGFAFPRGVAVDGAGNVFVADEADETIRRVTPEGAVLTVAGMSRTSGVTDGVGSAARFDAPVGIAVDAGGTLYVSDLNSYTIRKITPDGTVSTFAGSPRRSGTDDGVGAAARFYDPGGLALDRSGNLYVRDWFNFTVRKITPQGVVTTIAGTPRKEGYVDGQANAAQFDLFGDIAVDNAGNLFLADASNNAIRKVSAMLPDTARIDAASGAVGVTRLLDTAPSTATSWEWSVTRQPTGSKAALSSAAVRAPTFTPDVAGRYEFRLMAQSRSGASISSVVFEAVPSAQEHGRAVRH